MSGEAAAFFQLGGERACTNLCAAGNLVKCGARPREHAEQRAFAPTKPKT